MAVSVKDVRDFLRDNVDENFLTDQEDFSNELIAKALRFVVADFNETPVITAFSVTDFPFANTLLYGVAAWLLDGLAISQTRNHLPYSTAGVTVDDSNKGPEYAALANKFKQEYMSKKREIKNQINLDSGWADVLSEYFTNRAW